MDGNYFLIALIVWFRISGTRGKCSIGWHHWKHRCYFVDQAATDYAAAAANCTRLGARLAVPNSADEYNFIASITDTPAATKESYYLGCQTISPNSPLEWLCVDGSSLGTHDCNNNVHQPDVIHFFDPAQITSPGDDSLVTMSSLNPNKTPRMWRDAISTNRPVGYVCEYGSTAQTREPRQSHVSVQKDTLVSFPTPDLTVTGIRSHMKCMSICTEDPFAMAANFDQSSETCHCFTESMWQYRYNSAKGWKFSRL